MVMTITTGFELPPSYSRNDNDNHHSDIHMALNNDRHDRHDSSSALHLYTHRRNTPAWHHALSA
jgi:hypothetical protein